MNTNQHYITKSYLDKFVHPQSENNVLYPYRKRGGACRPRGTKKLGSAINFYTQRVNGQLTDQLDEARKCSETLYFSSGKRTPSVLSKCIYDLNFHPSREDTKFLAGAASFLICGSPIQIHNTAMISLLSQQMWAFNRLASPDVIAAYREQYGDDAEQHLGDDRTRLWTGDLFLDIAENESHKQLGFESYNMQFAWIEHLCRMTLTVVDVNYKLFFVTSDNPVVLSSANGNWTGLRDRYAEVWFPISWNRGLLWTWGNKSNRTTLGYSKTCELNRRIIKWCYKFVYSPRSSDWIVHAARNERFNPLFGHYNSLEKLATFAKPCYDAQTGELLGDVVEWTSALRSLESPDILGI